MLAFILSPVGRYVVGALVALSVLAGTYTYLRTHFYNAGWNAAINAIAAKNKEATDAVEKAVSNVNDCNAAGGTWDTTTGLCQR